MENVFFDLAKYIVTAIVFSALFKAMSESGVLTYTVALSSVILFMVVGALLYDGKLKEIIKKIRRK